MSFKGRLWLGHMIALASVLIVAVWVANWELRRAVLRQVIDNAILALASKEAAALQEEPGQQVRVHEIAPGHGPPSFERLDKFVQIVDLEGRVIAAGATLGTARLPVSPSLLAHLRGGKTVFETLPDFGGEPVQTVVLPITIGDSRYAVQVGVSLDDAHTILGMGAGTSSRCRS